MGHDRIYIRTAQPGESFTVYSGPNEQASGQFLSPGLTGQTPSEIQQTLALPPGNTAEVSNNATINQPVAVLEGQAAPQNWDGNQELTGGGWQVLVPGGASFEMNGHSPPVTIE